MATYALFTRRIGLTAVTQLSTSLSLIILLPVLTKTLSTADYGSWALILVTVNVVPMLATLGMPMTLVRFLAASKNKQFTQQVFYSTGFVVLLPSLVVSGLFVLFAPQLSTSLFSSDLGTALLLPPIILVACLNFFLYDYFRARQQIKKFSILYALSNYLNLVLIAGFVFSGNGLRGAVLGLLMAAIIMFLLMGYLILSEIGFAIPRFESIREHLAFGLPLVPSSASSWIVSQSDRYLIGILLGTVAVAYYSPAYSLGSNLTIASAPLTLLLPAVLSKHHDEDNVEDVKTIMKYSLKYYTGIVIPLAFTVSILSKPLLLLLTTQEIATNGYLVTPFVAAGTVLVGAYQVINITLALKKRTAVTAVIWLTSAALNFGLNLLLIPYIGIVGAAFATMLAYVCAFTFSAIYSFRLLKFDINGRFILKSVCASLAVSLVLLLWKPVGLVNILASMLIAATVYLCILFILRGITIEEAKFFYGALRGR